jgi:uncharacterized protein DUF4157
MSFAAQVRTTSSNDRARDRRSAATKIPARTHRQQSLASAMIALNPARDRFVQRACGCGAGGMLEEDAMRAMVQPSLSISQPGDASEVEADRAADEIMRMPDLAVAGPQISRMGDASVHRSCAACSATQSDLSAIVARAVSGTGRALDEDTRGFMESRFGYDFNDVRIHTGSRAAESARALQAQAYTVGSDIVFAAGRYAPQTNSGRRLIAHELAHTVQQGGNRGAKSASGISLQRWPLSVMLQAAGCSGKSKKDCGGSCTHPTSGNPGTCRWSGTITYGCVCYENPSSKAVEVIVSALQALLIAAGIVLAAAALAALIACIASGVCEAGAIIAAAGFAAAILIIGFLRSQGITVTDDGGSVTSVDTSGTAEESAVA